MSWQDILKISPYEEAVAEEFALDDVVSGEREQLRNKYAKEEEKSKRLTARGIPFLIDKVTSDRFLRSVLKRMGYIGSFPLPQSEASTSLITVSGKVPTEFHDGRMVRTKYEKTPPKNINEMLKPRYKRVEVPNKPHTRGYLESGYKRYFDISDFKLDRYEKQLEGDGLVVKLYLSIKLSPVSMQYRGEGKRPSSYLSPKIKPQLPTKCTLTVSITGDLGHPRTKDAKVEIDYGDRANPYERLFPNMANWDKLEPYFSKTVNKKLSYIKEDVNSENLERMAGAVTTTAPAHAKLFKPTYGRRKKRKDE